MYLLDDTDGFFLDQFVLPDGRIFNIQCRKGTDDFYLRQDEIAQEMGLRLRQSPDHLWQRYLKLGGGEDFRDGLFAIHGCERVLFTDRYGHMWIKMELAMDFCNAYNPDLKEAILTYFRHHKLGLRGPGVLREEAVPAVSNTSKYEALCMFVEGFSALVRDNFTEVYRKFNAVEQRAEQDRQMNETFHQDAVKQIAAQGQQFDALRHQVNAIERVYTQWERTVTGFCQTFCGFKPSIEQSKQWGWELTKRYSATMPNGKFPKTACFDGGPNVNYYEPFMLIDHFTKLGLYKAPDPI